MGLEFKPLLPWEGEDYDRYPSEHFCEKQKQVRRAEEEAVAAAAAASSSSSSSFSAQQQRRSSNSSSNVSGSSMSRRGDERDFNLLVSESGVSSSSRRREEQELAEAALAVVNHQKLEYAMLVASSSEEEDNVVNPEYKSFFSIVLDFPQILGQGETKEYAMRQATRLMHFAFASMLLKGESIPPPTSGSVLEVGNQPTGLSFLPFLEP
jgi:predicted RNase H-like HicB family nuclease